MPLQASSNAYRGRFAPTPSGLLHRGSLLTALASWLEARSRGGRWLLRLDDLDEPRCPKGMDAQILRQLEAHGLTWDEAVRYQSHHVPEYRAALERLRAEGRIYRCRCTRATLAAESVAGPDGPVYAGTCRDARVVDAHASLRVRIAHGRVRFDDRWLGEQCRDGAGEIGDFVVERADGRIAYQLASAVDEHAQGITEVVRGADLLGSTFRQICLQRLLHLPPPRYGHIPVLIDDQGRKLSKQNHAEPIDVRRATPNLMEGLRLLGQRPPTALAGAVPADVLRWACDHWSAARVPNGVALAYNALQQTAFPLP